MARRIRLVALAVALAPALLPAGAAAQDDRDDFDRLGQINKASIVMLAEAELVPPPLAATIAAGIAQVIAEQDREGSRRSSDYLVFEERLVAVAGRGASRLHTGRSRQDIGSTSRRLALRTALLATYESLLAPRDALLALAERHTGTVIPGYTHGVQAQPTSLAHYLLAFAAALERDAERLEEAYARVNRSPLGAAALGTSGFPIDRERLAALLGFGGVLENSYDANHVSSVDSKTELASTLAVSAVGVGQFSEDVHVQYHDPAPWLLLDRSLTGISSIMPQKRNPIALERLRQIASTVLGDAQTVFLTAHNTSTGMIDYRGADQILETAAKARRMYALYADVVGGLVVDPARSLAEVDADYATMTEVADTLLRHADVPFRVGHHYASELTEYGRAHGKRPKELTAEELLHIYEETYGEPLPVSVDRIREALDPEQMVAARRGLGGPQPAETLRMLQEGRERLDAGRRWLDQARGALQEAETALEAAFSTLAATVTQ
ncbi:MAG: argininosuccinate lyase [Acidobacteria bacterium]|nr:argininosuccinate lyase [Acidobacteriota bacterium]